MKKVVLGLIFVLLWVGKAFSFTNSYAKNLKIVCTTIEAIDGKNAGFYYQLDPVNMKYFIKGIDVIDDHLNIKTNKTNIELILNKNSSIKSNILILEDTETFKEKLLVHTIFLNDLNGIFKSLSTNKNEKTEINYTNMSCAMLGSFPF